jgi:ABC-type antimicrobial peptide transport system permease subunit
MRYWLTKVGGSADLEEEMRLHVALRAEKLQAHGMERAEADTIARRRFGNQLQLQERSREMWISRWSIGMDFHGLETTVQNGLLRERLLATISGFFGLLAALIAAVGLYGVISYLVVRRTNELGIRMALGARPGHIIRTVVSRATLLVTVGILAGVAAGVAAARAARSMLFGVEPYDVSTAALAAFSLFVVALAASFAPAVRAVGLDPLVALRKD